MQAPRSESPALEAPSGTFGGLARPDSGRFLTSGTPYAAAAAIEDAPVPRPINCGAILAMRIRLCASAYSIATARTLARGPINAMDRDPVRLPLDTGVRAVNALLTENA